MDRKTKRVLYTIGIWVAVGIAATLWDYLWKKVGIDPVSSTRAEWFSLLFLIQLIDNKLED